LRGSLLVVARVAALLFAVRRAAVLLAPFGRPGWPRAGAWRGSLAGTLRGPPLDLRLALRCELLVGCPPVARETDWPAAGFQPRAAEHDEGESGVGAEQADCKVGSRAELGYVSLQQGRRL
jgi:hypothetical protein